MDPYSQRHDWEGTSLDWAFGFTNDYVIIIHVSDYFHFEGIVETNSPATELIRFKVLQDNDQAELGDHDKTPPQVLEHVDPMSQGGLIALKIPRFLHEKRKGSHPECARSFVFGRGSSLDLRVDAKVLRLGGGISRKHFAIGLNKGLWAVRNLALPSATKFRGKPFSELHADTVFLDPDNKNTLEIPVTRGKFVLDIYCRHPGLASGTPLLSALPVAPLISEDVQQTESTNSTTVAAPSALPGLRGFATPGRQTDAIIYFRPFRTIGRSGTPSVSALNAFTGDAYIAKIYDRSHMAALKRRLRLLTPIFELTQFLSDRFLRVDDTIDSVYLLSLRRDDITLLADWAHDATDLEQVARFVHWGLLAIIRQLHQKGIAHLDVCPDTVFVGRASDELYLGGFSEAKPLTPALARKDCRQVFETVKDILGSHCSKLPLSWLNHEQLDQLWSKFNNNPEPWEKGVIEVCEAIGNDAEGLTANCTSFQVTQNIVIRREIRDGKAMLSREDLRQYMIIRSLAWERDCPETPDSAKGSFTSLDRYGDDDKYISVEDIFRADNHIFKRHPARAFLVPDLSIDKSISSNRPLIDTVSMSVPCYSRHGLVNLSVLLLVMPDGLDVDGIRQRLTRYYEIRGYEGGIYIGVEDFPELANELRVRYDSRQIPARSNSSLMDCTSEDYFLLATNESATLYAVNRRTDQVLTQDGPIALSTYLAQTMPSVESLEAYTLDQALSCKATAEASFCGQSCTSASNSSGRLRFKPGTRYRVGPEAGTNTALEWAQSVSASKRRV